MAVARYTDPLYVTARRVWASRIDAGERVLCHLCGGQVAQPFHLDHVRGTSDLHPAHPGCNEAEGGRHGHRLKAARLLTRGGRSLALPGSGPTRQSPSLPRTGRDPDCNDK